MSYYSYRLAYSLFCSDHKPRCLDVLFNAGMATINAEIQGVNKRERLMMVLNSLVQLMEKQPDAADVYKTVGMILKELGPMDGLSTPEDYLRLGEELSNKETKAAEGREEREGEHLDDDEEHLDDDEEHLDDDEEHLDDDEEHLDDDEEQQRGFPFYEYGENGEIKSVKSAVAEVKFLDVVGLEEVKEEIRRSLVIPLARPDLAERYSLDTVSPILLYGPPGNGKSLIVRAISGELGIPYVVIEESSILSPFVGVSERNLQKIFNYAKKHEPFIVDLEELDGLGMARERRMGDNSVHSLSALLHILSTMEGQRGKVVVVGTTNSPWYVDTALLRGGRFGRWFLVRHPNFEERKILFQKAILRMKVEADVDLERLAKATEWASASEVIDLVRRTSSNLALKEMSTGNPQRLTTDDLLSTAKEMGNLGSAVKKWYLDAYNLLLASWDYRELIGHRAVDFISRTAREIKTNSNTM
ncbi:hypothetical protein HS1genome_1824 [Sulfodiicoccus acidiphilus]|uniref:ATPase AAA-type core domain-containing protein n=2 Tax=Sulfodiicoccus acidiphilus TaxID=1670455 RepID=A0A348B5I3_9CREN|nr:hypothetical protein HS1genome_1824 [Sulfodiicoccus acidiphilus]GGT98557.1 hypothetical protein GCM10007116_14950 [Sulfodiicoccus acidiphilus]